MLFKTAFNLFQAASRQILEKPHIDQNDLEEIVNHFNLFHGMKNVTKTHSPNFVSCIETVLNIFCSFIKLNEGRTQEKPIRCYFTLFEAILSTIKVSHQFFQLLVEATNNYFENCNHDDGLNEIARVFKFVLNKTDRKIVQAVYNNQENVQILYGRLAATSCIELQGLIVEIMLKLSESDVKIPSLIKKVSTAMILKEELYPCIRMVLDMINENSQKIFSILCAQITINGSKLFPFDINGFEDVFLDTDLINLKMSIFCDSQVLKSVLGIEYSLNLFEVISFHSKDVYLFDFKYYPSKTLELHIAINAAHVTPKSSQDSNLEIKIVCCYNTENFEIFIKNVLPKLFTAFKVGEDLCKPIQQKEITSSNHSEMTCDVYENLVDDEEEVKPQNARVRSIVSKSLPRSLASSIYFSASILNKKTSDAISEADTIEENVADKQHSSYFENLNKTMVKNKVSTWLEYGLADNMEEESESELNSATNNAVVSKIDQIKAKKRPKVNLLSRLSKISEKTEEQISRCLVDTMDLTEESDDMELTCIERVDSLIDLKDLVQDKQKSVSSFDEKQLPIEVSQKKGENRVDSLEIDSAHMAVDLQDKEKARNYEELSDFASSSEENELSTEISPETCKKSAHCFKISSSQLAKRLNVEKLSGSDSPSEENEVLLESLQKKVPENVLQVEIHSSPMSKNANEFKDKKKTIEKSTDSDSLCEKNDLATEKLKEKLNCSTISSSQMSKSLEVAKNKKVIRNYEALSDSASSSDENEDLRKSSQEKLKENVVHVEIHSCSMPKNANDAKKKETMEKSTDFGSLFEENKLAAKKLEEKLNCSTISSSQMSKRSEALSDSGSSSDENEDLRKSLQDHVQIHSSPMSKNTNDKKTGEKLSDTGSLFSPNQLATDTLQEEFNKNDHCSTIASFQVSKDFNVAKDKKKCRKLSDSDSSSKENQVPLQSPLKKSKKNTDDAVISPFARNENLNRTRNKEKTINYKELSDCASSNDENDIPIEIIRKKSKKDKPLQPSSNRIQKKKKTKKHNILSDYNSLNEENELRIKNSQKKLKKNVDYSASTSTPLKKASNRARKKEKPKKYKVLNDSSSSNEENELQTENLQKRFKKNLDYIATTLSPTRKVSNRVQNKKKANSYNDLNDSISLFEDNESPIEKPQKKSKKDVDSDGSSNVEFHITPVLNDENNLFDQVFAKDLKELENRNKNLEISSQSPLNAIFSSPDENENLTLPTLSRINIISNTLLRKNCSICETVKVFREYLVKLKQDHERSCQLCLKHNRNKK